MLSIAQEVTQLKVSSKPKEGVPGEYITVPFTIYAEGHYDYFFEMPTGWQALTPSGIVQVAGENVITLTTQIPDKVLAGQSVKIILNLSQNDTLLATFTEEITVKAQAKLSLIAPEHREGKLGVTQTYQATVVNEGNAMDSVVLSTKKINWDVAVEPSELQLAPQEKAVVSVIVVPTTVSGNGYRRTVILEASSKNDPSVKTQLSTVTTYWNTGNSETSLLASDNPQLHLKVSGTLGTRANLEDDKINPELFYAFEPELSGNLSDFVDVSVQSSELEGATDDIFGDPPSYLSVGLQGQSWGAGATVRNSSIGLSSNFALNPVRMAISSHFPRFDKLGDNNSNTYRLSVAASSLLPSLNLQANLSTEVNDGNRRDNFNARYQTPSIAEGLDLAFVLSATHIADGEFIGDANLTFVESLNWYEGAFDIAQSYTFFPHLNGHILSLGGGTSQINPLGVRTKAELRLAENNRSWNTEATLHTKPLSNVNFSLAGSLNGNDLTEQSSLGIRLSPRINFQFNVGFRNLAFVSARYTYAQSLIGEQDISHNYEVNFNFQYRGNLFVQANGFYGLFYPDEDPSFSELEGEIKVRYIARPANIEAFFKSKNSNEKGINLAQYTYGLAWSQKWTKNINTKFGYQHEITITDLTSTFERVKLDLNMENLFTDGVGLGLGYNLGSRSSLFDFDGDYEHSIRAGLIFSLNQTFSFDTPPPIINLFGGLKVGEVRGVAFMDKNFNNQQDEDEPPLKNIKMALGGKSIRTSEDGSYSIKLPAGSYQFQFLDGLPAKVDLLTDKGVIVEVNNKLERNLPFAPVASLDILIFDDANSNAKFDADEGGLSYARVNLQGHIKKSTYTDAYGRVTIAGLPAGDYLVEIDSDSLPGKYQPTKAVQELTLSIDQPRPLVTLGAAVPERKLDVVTFDSDDVAIIPTASPNAVSAGAEVSFTVSVSGQVDNLKIDFFDKTIDFQKNDQSWFTMLRIPLNTSIGPLLFPITAYRGNEKVKEQKVFVNVVRKRPFENVRFVANVLEVFNIEITTLFKADQGLLTLESGESISLTSEDGYTWQGNWQVGSQPKEQTAQLVMDDEVIGEVLLIAVKKRQLAIDMETPENAQRN